MPPSSQRPVIHALIPAAGRGERFGGSTLKQYLPLAGKPVLAHSIEAVSRSPEIAGITVALAEDDKMFVDSIEAEQLGVNTVSGGKSRAESVLNGLNAIVASHPETEWVLMHDAARGTVSILIPAHVKLAKLHRCRKSAYDDSAICHGRPVCQLKPVRYFRRQTC